MKEIIHDTIVGLLDIIFSSILWIAMAACMILVIVAVSFPAIMAANYSLWWLLGYVGYVAVAYFMCELFVR